MKKSYILLVIDLIFLASMFAGQAMAAEFHITNATEFQNALETSMHNGEDDTIYLSAGTFQGNFEYNSDYAKSLIIKGESGTTAEDIILDGNQLGAVVKLGGSSGGGNVTIEGVTVQDGSQSGL